MPVQAKICGLSDQASIDAAVEGGATWIGFISFPASPRHVEPDNIARLVAGIPPDIGKVAVTVDAEDALIDRLMKTGIDWLQLHGRESPERVAQVRKHTGLSVIKAIPVADREDLFAAQNYAQVADWLLLDAKPPKDALPGGNALAFNWQLLEGLALPLPWMLSGGLSMDNVAQAVHVSGARAVDISSGVESRRGVKDPERITSFLEKVALL